MNVLNNITEAIGKTPLVRIERLEKKYNSKAKLFVKVEGLNPAGSAKDRVGLNMILDAEKKGIIKSGGTIIEPTSGNTGIGLAMAADVLGYKLILTMPETMSVERRKLLSAYGAELVLTPGEKGMAGAVEKAQELSSEIEGSWIAGQFDNPANPEAHYKTTGPEIWQDMDGKIDCFVAGIGTGGTISGTGKYLKEKNPEIKIVGFEPKSSPLITEGKAGAHGLQGIGANFIPSNYDKTVTDEVITISDEEAYEMGRELCRTEGIIVGITSGAAIMAAIKLSERKEFEGKNIVVLLPDNGDKYLSTPMFEG